MGMIIAIDAGHYRYTPGKRCDKAIDPQETREWYLNDRMARHVAELLQGYDCEVIRCDDATGETDVSLYDRAARANRAGAAAFISIHHNAAGKVFSGGGICVYTTKNADVKRRELQKAVYDETVKLTGLKGNRATPLPVENHTVTYNAKMPAILGEFGFMDSRTDVPIILTDEFSKKCAQGIVNALVRVFNIQKKENDMNEKEVKALLSGEGSEVSAWAKAEMEAAMKNGITDGSRPMGYTTRQETAIMVQRAVDKIEKRLDKMADDVTDKIVGKILAGLNKEG